jgi:hypothetical protein
MVNFLFRAAACFSALVVLCITLGLRPSTDAATGCVIAAAILAFAMEGTGR